MSYLKIFFASILLYTSNILAINELIVRVPDIYLSRPGYIDRSTLVVEPHGGYTEQSLYLEYSDHNQFSPGQKVEVIHRFELPQGAVINDLWLWIGDSVMQAIMLDTWTARSIYDSIVSMKRDPAFLTKKKNQYELHIYPLTPGSFRKVKINFITPIRWIDKKAIAELPFTLLKSSNNNLKPLDVMFRVKQDIWGNPTIEELPSLEFSNLIDTLGYNFKNTLIPDISMLNNLKLNFDILLSDGIYCKANETYKSLNYFQLSLLPKDIFNIYADSSNKKVLIGLDLSGSFNKKYSTLFPNLRQLFKSTLKPDDNFNIIITGAGIKRKLSNQWLNAQPENIDNLLNSFLDSDLADSIEHSGLPRLIYADANAANCWGFTDIDSFAIKTVYPNLYTASSYLNYAEILASYNQGFEEVIPSGDLPKVIASLDSFFLRGGRFLTYFDFNRDSRENVATHYIEGLKTKYREHNNLTLFRNVDGNIGLDFPESIDHSGTYFLQYDDPEVKVELLDINGNPTVISKKIGNGLIVVSGIWSFNDDAPLKKLLTLPLLGLNNSRSYSQLGELLEYIKDEYLSDNFDKALVISNCDSLVLKESANIWATSYINQFGSTNPIFNTINLLYGAFPGISVNNITYYGAGYLTKKISDLTLGLHFETYLNDWDLISSILNPYSLPPLESFKIEKFGDNDTTKIKEFREVINEPIDPNSPRYFIGSTDAENNIKFNISAKFAGIDSTEIKSYTFPISYDTTDKKNITASMLANENLKDLFVESYYDTSQIIQIALEYNLLCDYTALIALEPNDTIHFLRNPFDEDGILNVTDDNKIDSLGVDVYPNPFNSQTKILVNVNENSMISIFIFNILGQLVKTISDNEVIIGKKIYSWNGTDNHNNPVSSGIYLLRSVITNNNTDKKYFSSRKIMLIK